MTSVASASAEAALRRRLRKSGVTIESETISGTTGTELSRIIIKADCELLLLPTALVAVHRAELQELLAAPTCAVLLVN
jgi:hypothetical protein